MRRIALSKKIQLSLESAALSEIYGDEIKGLADLTTPTKFEQNPDDEFGHPSMEGFLGDLFDKAKESLAQWTVGFRAWKAGGWSKLSDADKVRGIKKANLTFFYYNPKYVKDLENVFRLNAEAFKALSSKTGWSELEKIAESLVEHLTTIVEAAGGDVSKKTLKALQRQFKKSLATYKPNPETEGDFEAMDEIVRILDRHKLSPKDVDVLKTLSKGLGLEGSNRDALELQATIISCLLFFTGLWPLWIIWLLGIRDFYVNEASGKEEYY